jgi:hypothetical protein
MNKSPQALEYTNETSFSLSSAGLHSSKSKPASEYTKRDDHVDSEPAIQANLDAIRQGNFKSISSPEKLQHFKGPKNKPNEPLIGTDAMPHPIWSEDEIHNVQITHKKPKGFIDHFAYYGVQTTRTVFDTLTGYNRTASPSKAVWVNRLCFLETVAGVPGMVAAMVRQSLRRMRRDHGWIHTLLEEAENERMHLMVFLQIKQPSLLFRMCVMATQGLFVSGFSIAYLLSPKLCHRFVGYLEEEAVITYSKLLKQIESGGMQEWKTMPASEIAIKYWRLGSNATMRDVVLAIRADEAHHRVVNHTLSSMKHDDYNPYKPGE